MVRTYSNRKYIYSVDMMFAYINIFKPKYVKFNVSDLIHNLKFKGWADSKNGKYSPMDVLKHPGKYRKQMKRIHNADLNYPIIVYKNFIIDGAHRLSKSVLLGKKTIKVYVFDYKLMKKFIINSDYFVNKMEVYQFIELFNRRFPTKN